MTRTLAEIEAKSARNRKAWSSLTAEDKAAIKKIDKEEPRIPYFRTLKFELPFPPTLNNLFVNAPGRGRVPSTSAKEYRTKVITAVGVVSPLVGRLIAIVYLYPPTKRKLDIDNFVKAIFDGLGHAGVYQDDSQIDVLTILRMPVVSGGKAIVYLKEI